MPVSAVNTLHELTGIMDRSDANRLIIVDFYANWCGPCRMISPVFEQMSAEFGNATFLKVNCDQARDIVTRYGISAMPTFLFFKNKALVDTVRGANEQGIRSTIQKHYNGVPANPNSASDQEKRFLEQFVPYLARQKDYNDEVFKALARSVMPEEELIQKATNELGEINEIELLRNLLNWFKYDFFTWFDKPTCEKCTLKASTGGLSGTPTKEERENGANRVEVFICDGCNSEMRFPRYNNVAKLLQTRTGRCGEWANCFALMLSAIGLESRFVLDTTDHVWNEVYVKSENRWIHVDPCENIMDQPLLYTRGWKKQLTYCIAYGKDHVADVTWRYVFDAKRTAQMRGEVRPAVLENFLGKLNQRQMEGVGVERKKELEVRRIVELIEMIVADAKHQKIGWEKIGEDLGGRTTGSEEWRNARGEMGSSSSVPSPLGTSIKLTTSSETAEFTYDIIADVYSQEPSKGFISSAFEVENIQRVEEKDWKMVYLCRKDGKKDGVISWHFDLESIGKPLEKLEIRVAGIEKFEKGKAMVVACLGDTCMRIAPNTGLLTIDNPPVGILKITATLSGGEGSVAFQQAQIFRTKLEKSENVKSLLVKVWTKNQ